MASRCTVCDKTVRQNQHAIGCDKCDRWTHRSCIPGMTVSYIFRQKRGVSRLLFSSMLHIFINDLRALTRGPTRYYDVV